MTTPISIEPHPTLRNEKEYPFCPGCGHGSVLDSLNEAMVQLGLAPHEVVIVSDIGCSGLSDQYFTTSAFHGLHGRSVTYASGIKLARPDLNVIVIMGDGGTGIGGAHLLAAARRNIGITVLVLNNFNFGMTGGQHSTTTPSGFVTPTTPGGNLEHPLDIVATVGVNGAAYAYRGTNFDEDIAERMAEGITAEGFALLDVWDLCTAYFVPNNTSSPAARSTKRWRISASGPECSTGRNAPSSPASIANKPRPTRRGCDSMLFGRRRHRRSSGECTSSLPARRAAGYGRRRASSPRLRCRPAGGARNATITR
jgi:pyruvate/2-oxoacid:ferredoxin oxidoreductase beta subunit